MALKNPIDKRPPVAIASAEPKREYHLVEELALVSQPINVESDDIAELIQSNQYVSVLPVETLTDGVHGPSNEVISTIQKSALETEQMVNIRQSATIGPVLSDTHGAKFAVDPREALIGLYDRSANAAATFARDYELEMFGLNITSTSRLYRAKFAKDLLQEQASRLEADDRVLFAEYNPIISGGSLRDEFELYIEPENGGLELWNHDAIRLHQIAPQTNFSDTLVIVIDTLVDANHVALQGSLINDPISTFNLIGAQNGTGHGTAVASLIGSKMEMNANHAFGLAAGVNILCVAGLHPYGSVGAQARLDAINLATEIAREGYVQLPNEGLYFGAKRVVVNCSWKLGDDFSNGVTTTKGSDIDLISFRVAFQELQEAGALVVCSAGNSNDTIMPHFPSDYEGCISTAALDKNNKRYAADSGSNFGPNIDISAPGSGLVVPKRPDGFRLGNGTSFAAPHVTAACAHFWSSNPSLAAADVRKRILTSGYKDISSFNPTHINELGSGIVDLPNLMRSNTS